MPNITKEEIIGTFDIIFPSMIIFCVSGGCQIYFRSLSDDNKRRKSGAFEQHRLKQKKLGRLKQVC